MPPAAPKPEYAPDDPERFINREVSWLAFNRRVLEEASNPAHPLLERLRFLSISANNLDEFYMVRVAGLKGQVEAGVTTPSMDGLTPAQQLAAVDRRVRGLVAGQYGCWRELLPELRDAGIDITPPEELGAEERAWLEAHFMGDVFPVLTALAVDPAHPFPFIPNFGFGLALDLHRPADGRTIEGLVPIPVKLDRFVALPGRGRRYLAIEHMVALFLDPAFPGVRSAGRRLLPGHSGQRSRDRGGGRGSGAPVSSRPSADGDAAMSSRWRSKRACRTISPGRSPGGSARSSGTSSRSTDRSGSATPPS